MSAVSSPPVGLQMCPRCSRNSRTGSRFCGYCGEQLNPQRPLLAAGTVLQGRYTVVRLLGMGAMGAVYYCDDVRTGTAWAVKDLLDKTLVEQFRLEAETLRRLHHPHLPAVVEYFEQGGTPYFVMELIEGKSLDAIVTEKKKAGSFLPVTTVVRWGVQLCDVLAYIHGQTPPVIHRDIKPENIKFTPTGAIKLVDFGLLKLFDPAGGLTSRLIASMGSEGYTAYEQYLNTGATGPATDIYALGATLYTLLTNEIPPTPPDRLAAPRSLTPMRAINPAVVPALEMAIAKAMAIEGSERFGSATQFRAALQAAVPLATTTPPTVPIPTSSVPQGPLLPFTFRDGSSATTPAGLADLLEQHRAEGMEQLYGGGIVAWLRAIGRDELAARADTIRQTLDDRAIGIECLVRLLNPALPAPRLATDATALSFGQVPVGTVSTQVLTVTNRGRGYLHGHITASAPWLSVAPARFGLLAGEKRAITVTASADTVGPGRVYNLSLALSSNGGSLTLPVSVEIRKRSLLRLMGVWGAALAV